MSEGGGHWRWAACARSARSRRALTVAATLWSPSRSRWRAWLGYCSHPTLPAATRGRSPPSIPIPPRSLHSRRTSQHRAKRFMRCNLLRRERSAVQAMLQSQLDNTFRVAPHPILFDVLVIRRTPCDACLTPFLELRHIHGTDRFAARKRHGCRCMRSLLICCVGGRSKGRRHLCARRARRLRRPRWGERVSVYADLHGTLLRGSVCESLEGMALLSVGTCVLDRPAIFREAFGLAVKIEHIVAGDLPAIGNLLNAKGEFYVQSLPSLVVAHVLNAQPGERILDMRGARLQSDAHCDQLFEGH